MVLVLRNKGSICVLMRDVGIVNIENVVQFDVIKYVIYVVFLRYYCVFNLEKIDFLILQKDRFFNQYRCKYYCNDFFIET